MEGNGVDALLDYKRCRICLEKVCKGKCNCRECKNLKECPRILSATIRITNKCTQKCAHCCFDSSPRSKIMMTPETANEIAQFIKINHVFMLNVMGGEFFCNPSWPEILDSFASAGLHMRLVSNSDWARSKKVREGLEKLFKAHDNIKISLSSDKWHTNLHVQEAAEFLESIGANYNIESPEEGTDASIVPVGRGELCGAGGLYSMFGNFCGNPKNMYSFLIDETGSIYKCEFGTWKYAKVQDYLEGGFEDRFKEFNKKFYSIFIPNCLRCRRSAETVEGDVTVPTK